jgi:hypothetical protein
MKFLNRTSSRNFALESFFQRRPKSDVSAIWSPSSSKVYTSPERELAELEINKL